MIKTRAIVQSLFSGLKRLRAHTAYCAPIHLSFEQELRAGRHD